ncbi:MAG TPA: hypothetical protein VFB51_00570 [Solirubrobacterales bacterium]|nr:hypothetical protein [Solirubrobacterales bacterium]
MISLLVCWVLFPLAVTAVSLGCGLLLERAAGIRLPAGLLAAAGFAVVLVTGHVATAADATAELAVPAVLVLAVAGVALSLPLRDRRVDWWAVAAGCAVYGLFAAPVVLSGDATFAGYIKLDDTATWLAMTDRLMEHGRDVNGLAASSYETALDVNLSGGYPVGAFPPLGIGARLVGQDPAWVFQPYQALLAAYMALALYAVSARMGVSRPLRALAAVVASQSALLFAYSLWGGVKELAAAWAVALLGALLIPLFTQRVSAYAMLPLACASAALLAVLSFGGVIWLAPVLIPAAVVLGRLRGAQTAAIASAVFVGLTALLAAPTLLLAETFLKPARGTLTSGSELGNLIEPLSRLQLAGIWPVGDFRFEPDALAPTYLVIGLLLCAAALGVWWAWRREAWELLLYLCGAVGGALAISFEGSPWVGAKALATGSPAILLAGVLGIAVLTLRGRRAEAAVIGLLVTGGVVWSNVLAYHEVNLAPRDRHEELEEIGAEIAGQGPTLMTEYEPYGVRHFLREGDPEGASELRRRPVLLRTGRKLEKIEVADVDELADASLLVYRTLVLRRSPVASRPPSVYRKVRSGRYYEVWQRAPGAEVKVIQHMPLGYGSLASAPVPCDGVRQLAGLARTQGGQLAVARRPAPARAGLAAPAGSGWRADSAELGAVIPDGSARQTVSLKAPVSALYDVYVRGSFRGRLQLDVDGRRISSEQHMLSHAGQYEPLGSVRLAAGRHDVAVDYTAPTLRPGSGGPATSMGPLYFAPRSDQRVERVPPARAGRLCERSLDWVEAVTR